MEARFPDLRLLRFEADLRLLRLEGLLLDARFEADLRLRLLLADLRLRLLDPDLRLRLLLADLRLLRLEGLLLEARFDTDLRLRLLLADLRLDARFEADLRLRLLDPDLRLRLLEGLLLDPLLRLLRVGRLDGVRRRDLGRAPESLATQRPVFLFTVLDLGHMCLPLAAALPLLTQRLEGDKIGVPAAHKILPCERSLLARAPLARIFL